MKHAVQIDPLNMGKAIACTNFVMAFFGLVAASLAGIDMTGSTWKMLLVTPILLALVGLLYGLVGGSIYNAMVRKKGEGAGLVVTDSPS